MRKLLGKCGGHQVHRLGSAGQMPVLPRNVPKVAGKALTQGSPPISYRSCGTSAPAIHTKPRNPGEKRMQINSQPIIINLFALRRSELDSHSLVLVTGHGYVRLT